jgi:excisionase family DNA binding protein
VHLIWKLFGFAGFAVPFWVGRALSPQSEGAKHARACQRRNCSRLERIDSMKTRGGPLLNVADAALMLGVGRSTLYRAVRAGTVPFPVHRIGGVWYVPRRALERFLDGELDQARSSQAAPNASDVATTELAGISHARGGATDT